MNFINQLLENLYKKSFVLHLKTIFGYAINKICNLDMQLISKYNKWIRFLLCVIDVFSKYAWVVPLKDKRGITIVKAF